MALANSAQWAVSANATTGNVNGAYFNPANANMLTNLAATSATGSSPVVSSASYNFASGDVGAWLYIQSGTNWTPGWYQIASVASNKATLTAGVGTAVTAIGPTGIVTYNASAGCATTASPSSGVFTIDYSQQNTAQINGTDFTATGNSTTAIALSETFTPVMVGNGLQLISATGGTPVLGWFEIVSYSSAHDVVLDRTPTDGTNAITAGTYYVGGAGRFNGNENAMFNAFTAGSLVWVLGGGATYTFSAGISAGNSITTAALPCLIIGYTANRGDVCVGANLPVFTMGANVFEPSFYFEHFNIKLTGTAAEVVENPGNSGFILFRNSKCFNSSTTANRYAFQHSAGGGNTLYDCEAVSQNGIAIDGYSLQGCFAHDSVIGIDALTVGARVVGNLVASCTTQAINFSSNEGTFTGNTLYGRSAQVGTGINFSSANSAANLIANNIITGMATGISVATGASYTNSGRNNDFYNNGTDVTNWTKDASDLAVNPSFTSVSEVTGTAATSSGSVLTDSGASFITAGVTANVSYLHVTSGTGVTVGCYLITAVTATTLTTNNALGTSSAGNIIYWIRVGNNFTPTGSGLLGTGFPTFTNATPATTSYPDVGAVTVKATTGGGGASAYS